MGLLAGFVTLFAVAPGASAAFHVRMEGENSTVNGAYCLGAIPNDSERVQPVPLTGASNDKGLFFPNGLCHAAYEVFTPVATRLTVASTGPGGAGECGAWFIVVDGAVAGWTTVSCTANTIESRPVYVYGLSDGEGQSYLTVPPGLHTIAAVNEITAGPGWANMVLDYIDFDG